MSWSATAAEKARRYEEGAARVDDERSVVRQGNVAYAAGLALLMDGDPAAGEWLRRAASDWRTSWDVGGATDAWGRPIGALKASLLAGDEPAVEELARWTLELGTATAASPIGRYAACLALLALGRWAEARHAAVSLLEREDFPHDVADALAAIAAHDVIAAIEAIESVVASFERRDAYLEDMAVADTALVLRLLAARRGIEVELPASPVLPPA
ncbi:MAG TPA: hypothetical protein VHB30_05920 [Solirubrobacteraceae bacterium]|nr:hypothetical protein [Solirubrobacteraceae bacterium]